MKVLFLGPDDSPLVEYLKSVGEEVIATTAPITVTFLDTHQPDFIISYGYRHTVKRDVLDRYAGKAINLHISYLPWNRGADPNFWSFLEDTPKGVTIHYLDEGIDTGDIITQREVEFSQNDTLRTSYAKLQTEIQTLFKEHWVGIRAGRCGQKKQSGKGTYHRLKDKDRFSNLLVNGWDTPVAALKEYAAGTHTSVQLSERYDAEAEKRDR